MAELKYVMTSENDFALGPTHIGYIDMSRQFEDPIIGAGRCDLAVDRGDLEMVRVRCFGEAASIGVQSRGEIDAAIISRYINGI